jgi:peptidoglycan/xylan/chitin deacetylase (PgdA/CDA1 family)
MGRRLSRQRIKKWGGRALSALPGSVSGSGRARVVVLCYHSIHPTSFISCAAPDLFEEHLRWLSSECECVRFSEIHRLASGPPRDTPVVAVTFDDGYADNHETALPMLERWGIPATFFLTSGLIEMDPAVVERFRSLYAGRSDEVFRAMTWSQAREILDAGMEIGAHTYRHPNLALLSEDQIRAELERSKQVLEDRLNADVTTMSYPFGKPRRHLTPQIARIAGEVGFRFAGSIVHRGVRRGDDPLQIPRFTIVHDPIDTLRAKVRGVFDIVGIAQERSPLWAAKLLAPEDFRFGA